MQFLLTEEEMERIRLDRDLIQKIGGASYGDNAMLALTNVVQHVATTMVATVPVNGQILPPGRPHGCIHVPSPDPRRNIQYCDGCQVAGICPQTKNWSK